MRKSFIAYGLCGYFCMFGMAVSSASTLDQAPNPANTTQGLVATNDRIYHQVITTGLAGTLDKVELLMQSVTSSTTLEDVYISIETASGGIPTGVKLATVYDNFSGQSFPSTFISFDFSSFNLSFDVGDEFAISVQSAITGSGGTQNQYVWVRDLDFSLDLYTGGGPFQDFASISPTGYANDFIFKTYVTPYVVYSCVGFEPPLNSGAVKVRKKRALPLKAELLDVDGISVTDVDIVAAPVLQVIYSPGNGGDSVDVTDDALAVGLGTEGNQFEYNFDKWQYNLKTDNYAAPGSYRVSVSAGDSYVIDPTCEVTFVVQ